MLYKVADGSMVDIVIGSQVVVRDGILPPEFNGVTIEVLALDLSGPMAQLEAGQLSVISPELIEVII